MQIKNRFEDYVRKHLLFSVLFSAFIGWALSWVLPAKPVSVRDLPQKELTCTLNYSTHLIKKQTTDSKLQILYDGQAVTDPYMVDITITNTGNYAISNEDFKDDFVVEFQGCDKILSVQVSNPSNHYILDDVLSSATTEESRLVFADFLLNPNETFSINAITDKAPDAVIYHSRISGVSELTIRNTPKEKHKYALWSDIAVIVAISILFFVLLITERRERKKYQRKIDFILNSSEEDTTDA